MRLLLDEAVPRRLGKALPSHAVRTLAELGWSGIKNGALLARAAADFDALITVDKNLEYQQNLAALPLAVVVLDTRSVELSTLLSIVPRIEIALSTLVPRTLVRIAG